MGHILATMFSWPNGIVVGNLIASAIWAPIGIIHLDRLMRRHRPAARPGRPSPPRAPGAPDPAT